MTKPCSQCVSYFEENKLTGNGVYYSLHLYEATTDLLGPRRFFFLLLTAEMSSSLFFSASSSWLKVSFPIFSPRSSRMQATWARKQRPFRRTALARMSTYNIISLPTSLRLTFDTSQHISVMRSPTWWLVDVLRWVPVRDKGEREYPVQHKFLPVWKALLCISKLLYVD